MQAVCCLPYDFCLFANQFVHLQGQSWVCCYFCVWKRCWTRQVTKFGFEHRYSSASDTETRVPLLIRSPHLQNTNTSTARVWHIRHTKKGPNAISEISHSPFHTQPLPGPKAHTHTAPTWAKSTYTSYTAPTWAKSTAQASVCFAFAAAAFKAASWALHALSACASSSWKEEHASCKVEIRQQR